MTNGKFIKKSKNVSFLVISVLVALFGVFSSAILIAVFTSKISLNRSEQMVVDFVNRIDRARAYKEKTIQMIQYSVRAWFLKRHGHHYRATFNTLCQLHSAVRQIRNIKQQQRNAANENETMMTVLTDVHDEQKNNDKILLKFKQQMTQLEEKMNKLELKMNTVINILTRNMSGRQDSWL